MLGIINLKHHSEYLIKALSGVTQQQRQNTDRQTNIQTQQINNQRLTPQHDNQLTANLQQFTSQQNYPMTDNDLTRCFNATQHLTNYF